MSGNDVPQGPPEVPEEYAAVYRDAYLRALEQESEPATGTVDPTDPEHLIAPDPEFGPWRRFRGPLLIALVVAVLAVLAFGIGRLIGGSDDPVAQPAGQASSVPEPTRTSPSTGAEPDSTSTPDDGPSVSTAAAWDGAVTAVTPDQVTATCTAKPGVDSAGRTVDYGPSNSADGDPSTAWRCQGRAIGQSLTITLPAGTEVGEVGLVPGYAKTDPRSGIDRYAENNRITRVRWTLGDGVVVEQDLDPTPDDRSVQSIRVPRTESGSITVEVLAVDAGPRNTTAISEIEVAAAG